MRNNLLPIAKEGWNYILSAIALFILFAFLDFEFLQFFAFISGIFLLYIFRNPERQSISFEDASVVSPVDGVISSIDELESNEYGYKIEIDGGFLSVCLLRVPLTSTLSDIKIYRGARISKSNLLSSDLNENAELIFTDKNNNSLKVHHRLKQSFKSIEVETIKSQKLTQSSRYGVMVNGTTTLYLPKNFRLNVSVGSEVVGAETLVGYFTN